MRIDELEEAEVKKAVFTFGRLNPPHYGHHALVQTLQKTAEKQGCDWFLFVSSKTGDEKNPLTYEQKVWWIEALFPETKGHLVVDASVKTPLVAATWLYKKGYHAATFVAGEDDMASYGEMIKSGNAHGIKNPDSVRAGKGFVFNPLDFAISPRLASATNARKNVTDGDPEAFVRSILGPKISPELSKLVHDQLYPTLRKTMGLSESAELSKSTPSVRDLAKKYATDPSEIYHQVNRGVKVEYEHTNDIEVATEIAMDHLKERLDYYDLLDKLEKSPKKKFGENFADGKGPGRPGDSQRHGIPKKASISQLEKASHATGRKGQLARWQLNMRRGKKRANEEVTNEVADQPYRFISPVSTATTQKSMFNTDSGTTIQVFIQVDTGNGVADIGFFDATDKENPTIGVTGKGDAFRVFATVGSIVKQFVAKRKPPYISFSGKSSDAGRIKLYDMIAKNIGRYLPEYKLIDSGFANGDKGYTFKRVAQESFSEEVALTPEAVYKKIKIENLGISFEEFERYVDQAIEHHSKLYTYWHKFKDHKKAYHLAQQEVLKNLYRNKKYYMSKPVIKADPIDPTMSNSDWWKNKISEEKKPKKPKTIIDGALKTLIAKGRSEDEAIADLKKEIDGKFYDLTETREGALNWLKSYLPSWPEYVLRDWLYRGLTKHDPGENPKEVVDRSLTGEGMSAQTQWKLISNFEFKIEKLHPDTQRRINIRAGGSANPMKVPKDAERHATQAALAQQQGGVRKEPVIGKMTPQGFELIEGWHRTIQHFKQFPDGYRGPAWVAMNAVSESISEAKVKLYTDPDYFGSDVDDSVGDGLPVVNIPLDKLVGFEPDSKMKDAQSAMSMKNMTDIIKAGRGKDLPPIFVRKYKGGYQVLDGHHRFHAFKAAGAKTIPAKIIPDSEIEEFDKAPKIEESVNLLERKMADLYHSTDIENLPSILKSGALVPSRNEYVSLSRDKNYNFASSGTSDTAVFVVDQARLAYNHKIQPFDWHMSDAEDPEAWARDPEFERRKESEERVKGPISLKFVKEIWLPKSWGLKQSSSTKKILDNIRQLGISVQFVTEESLEETLKKVKGEWALVSRQDPSKVLQYYHGSGHPSKDWVSKVERRVHSFESIMEDDAKPRVYLDMDGVLADFFGEWSRISNVDHYKDINDVEAKLQLVRDHPTFWIDLPMLPHAKALIKAVVEKYGEYRICSKPLEGDTRSKPGKMEWIQKHLSDMPPVEVILTADKARYATHEGAPNILVDDYGVNINSWRAAGGIGIKYEDSAFPQVAKILTSIAKSGVSK